MHDRQVRDHCVATDRRHMLSSTHGEPVNVRVTDGFKSVLAIDDLGRHAKHRRKPFCCIKK